MKIKLHKRNKFISMPLIFYDFSDIRNSSQYPMPTNCYKLLFALFGAQTYSADIAYGSFWYSFTFLYSPHLINDKAFEKWWIDGWVELIWIKYTQAFRPAYNEAFLALINRWKHLSIFIMMKIHLSLSDPITSHLFTTLSPQKLTPLNHFVIKFKRFFSCNLWSKAHVYLCLIALKNI